MARPSRTITTLLFALTLGIGFTPTVQAQPAQPPAAASTPGDNNADYVAPGREDLEPAEPGFDDNNVDNQAGKNWHPTINPKSKVIPGQMRSDKEEIPGGFTKEQANRAEVQEAKEQATQARSGSRLLPLSIRAERTGPARSRSAERSAKSTTPSADHKAS